MRKGVKILLIVLGAIVALLLIAFIVLYAAGGQNPQDPFTKGIDVVDVPFTTPGTVTWRIVGASSTDTALYVSTTRLGNIPAGVSPDGHGLTRIEATSAVEDGVTVYQAAVPAGAQTTYVSVYALIDGAPQWSQEYDLEAST